MPDVKVQKLQLQKHQLRRSVDNCLTYMSYYLNRAICHVTLKEIRREGLIVATFATSWKLHCKDPKKIYDLKLNTLL